MLGTWLCNEGPATTENPEDYLYSRARNYAGLKAMCVIDFL